MTSCVVFVNTKAFAEKVLDILRKKGLKPAIIFGNMEAKERDEMMEKFRKGVVHVVITTNLLARGVDIPEIEIVINFDVPT